MQNARTLAKQKKKTMSPIGSIDGIDPSEFSVAR
jgi:hypothetical protein